MSEGWTSIDRCQCLGKLDMVDGVSTRWRYGRVVPPETGRTT